MTSSVAFYDARAEQAVNETASAALDFLNQLMRENGRERLPYNLAEVCFWSAQAVAPDAGLQRHLQMARLAAMQVRDVMARLRDCEAA